MAELFTKISPKIYCKYIYIEKGKSVLYVKLQKSLYGTLREALLLWRNHVGNLHDWGFTLNLYDLCIANKYINSSQLSFLWHVDNLKILHINSEVVSSFIRAIQVTYGKISPVMVS